MIDPNAVNTVRVGELAPADFNLTDNLPHEIGTELKRGTVQQLADVIGGYLGTSDALAFNPETVPDGGTLPATTSNEWMLVGKGTFHNVGGGADIITTEELNAVTSNGTYWSLAVEIPINVELAGITQNIRSGYTVTTPSEDAVYQALALKLNISDIAPPTPDATTTVKGILKLAGDLGGTADLPTTPTALHITGNEQFSGQKSFTNTTSTNAKLFGTQNATSGNLVTLGTGSAVSGGVLLYINSTGGNADTNVAKLLVLNAGSDSIGMPFTIQNSGVDTLTISKTGSINGVSATFSGNVSAATPTLSTHLVTKAYADGLVVGLLDDRGSYNASTNLFPSSGGSGTAGAILKGDLWYVSVAGILGGKAVAIGDSFRALVDTPGQTAGNWSVLSSNLGYVPANDANVLHTSGGLSETFTGVKSATNTGSTITNGLSLTNNGTSFASYSIGITNTNTGAGLYSSNSGAGTALYTINTGAGKGYTLNNASTGIGMYLTNVSTGSGISSVNSSSGFGIYSENSSSGVGIRSNNSSTGNGIVSNGESSSTGFVYVGQNSSSNTFTVNKTGDVVANSYTGGAALTGTPTAPTAITGTSTTQIATTAFVQTAFNVPVSSSAVGIVNNTALQELGGADKRINGIQIGTGKPFGNTQQNRIFGVGSMLALTTGSYNSAFGTDALRDITTGSANIGIGLAPLRYLTTGGSNIGIGQNAGTYLSDGTTGNLSPSQCLYIGDFTRSFAASQANEIIIGYGAYGNGTNSVTLGSDSVTKTILKGDVGIGTATPSAKLVVVDNSNTYSCHFSSNGQTNGIAVGTNVTNVPNIQGINKTFTTLSNIALQPAGGNVLIGTTTDDGVNKLQVNGSISASAYSISGPTGTITAFFNAMPVSSTQIQNNDVNTDTPLSSGDVYMCENIKDSGSNGVQTLVYYTGSSANRIFVRSKASGTWSAWVEK